MDEIRCFLILFGFEFNVIGSKFICKYKIIVNDICFDRSSINSFLLNLFRNAFSILFHLFKSLFRF